MSLEGAKLICLDEAGNHGEIVMAKGRKFTLGYYVNCDCVLVDERAKGVHCEIECDAFGRVTIRNLSPDKPILVNGSPVEVKRFLLNNSKLSILDKEYLWSFPKSSRNEFENISSEDASTPQKQIGIPEQPPNSCPDFKLHREVPKRFTVHNFAYCIQSDEEGNISSDTNNESTAEKVLSREKDMPPEENTNLEEKNQNTTENRDKEEEDTGQKRSITPEPKKENANTTSNLLETPKMNLINCTNDKENKSTQKKDKPLLTMCHLSDVVITSFSPRQTGVKIEKSFATIIKPKLLDNKPTTTTKNFCSTPKGEMNEIAEDASRNLISFHTPSTSKTGAVTGLSSSTASKVLKNSSMHLIDLTTPNKLRPASPYLKSALKAAASIKKNPTQSVHKSQLISEDVINVSELPSTPAINETPSSIISVSSIDTPSVIEVTSDASNMGITPVSGLNTPKHLSKNTGVSTPKRTPQSLMKRALLTSAKKQTATPQTNTFTPRRDSLNRIPLRSALLRTPITPQNATADKSTSQLSRRLSMSTPSRKSAATRNLLDNSPSTSKTAIASSRSTTRRSSLNPISALRNVPTSTPMANSSNNGGLRTRAACRTSPLHKVRKSISGIPLSSHISKSRRTIVLPSSTSKLTSLKDKSPQQIMSNRLVNRARKSLGISPITTRSRTNTPAARKTIEPGKTVLFDDKHTVDRGAEDDLSRTFIIESDEDDNVKDNIEKDKPKDVTFSPVKDNTINLVTTSTRECTTVAQQEQQGAVEIPLDVEEVSNISKNQNPSSEQNVLNKADIEKKLNEDVFKDIPDADADAVDKGGKPLVAEESFAEIINLTPIGHAEKAIEIFNSPEESSQTESQKSFAEIIDVEQHTVATAEDSTECSIENKSKKTEEVLESGFGEESMAVAKDTSETENTEQELAITYASEISNKDIVEDKSSFQNRENQYESPQFDDLIVESTIDVTELANKNSNKSENNDEKEDKAETERETETSQIESTVESTIDVTELANTNNIQNKAELQEDTIENENDSNKSENNDKDKAENESTARTESETIGDEPGACVIESVNNEIISEILAETSEKENSHDVESFAQNITESIEENIAITEDKLIHKNDDKDSTPHHVSETIEELEAVDTASCLNLAIEDNEKGNTFTETETVSEPMNESKIGETVRTESKEVLEDRQKSETLSVSTSKSANAASECDTEALNNVLPPEVIIENIEEDNTPQIGIVSVSASIAASEELYVESTDNEITPHNEPVTNVEKNVSQNESVSSPNSLSEPKICETKSNKSECTLEAAVEEDKETTNTSQIVPEADTEGVSNDVLSCPTEDNKDEPSTIISQAMVEKNEKEDTQVIESSKSEFTADVAAQDENIPHELTSNIIADNNEATILSIPQAMVADIGKESSSPIVPPVSAELIISESEITKDEKKTSSIIDNNEEESKDEHSVDEKDEILPKTALATENKKEENHKSFEYKPIYEDITVEGSLIEKELTEEAADNAESKQPIYEDITIEGSAIETPGENEILENKNINDDPSNTVQTELEIKERSNETVVVALEVYQTETVDNFENTTKLLEEIEDVLNKSDEIKQKHLNELDATQEESGDNKPLTEEYENLTQETSLSCSSAVAGEKTASDNEIEINKDLIVTEKVDSALNNASKEAANETENEANQIETKCPHSESKHLDDSETKETLTNQFSSIETETNEESVKPTDITTLTESNNSENENVKQQNTEFREEVAENETHKQNIASEDTHSNSNIVEVSNEEKDKLDSTLLLRTNQLEPKMDNTTCLTPKRRSTRRASQSADIPQTSSEASFTPRRSTRRASMSAETTLVSTPTRKSTRRASMSAETTTISTPTRKSTRRVSLSGINETTSVPQIITRRRASMSVDEEITNKPAVTCKTPRARTPQKQIKQKMIIAEELDKVITSTILEEEDENVIVECVSQGETRKTEITPIVEESVSTSEKLQLQEELADDIHADAENLKESKSENIINTPETLKQSENMESITQEMADPIEKSEIETVQEALTIENMSNDEEIKEMETEIIQDSSNCPLEQVISSTTDNPSSGDTKETELPLAGTESSLTESVDVSNAAAVQKDKLMESADENPNTPNEIQESHVNEDDQSSSITSVTTAAQELMETPKATGNKDNDNASVENEKEIPSSESSKTVSTAVISELLKTPKLDAMSPKLDGIQDLVHTATQNRECEKEETEILAVAAPVVVVECEEEAETSLIGENVENIDSSPGTPLMKGMRELLKTSKLVIDSPNLAGLGNLLQTPKEISENEQKEIEKPNESNQTICLDSEEQLDATPTTLVEVKERLETPKLKKPMAASSVEIENKTEDPIESEAIKDLKVKAQEMSLKGVKQLLKTPKPATDTPQGLKGIRELLKTPKSCSTPLLMGVKELLDSSVQEMEMENVSQISYVNQIEESSNPEAKEIEENVASTSKNFISRLSKLKRMEETPKRADIKESEQEFDKFLKTPTAKNIMIPIMPSSAVIEKSADSIEVSTEYDLNATNEGQTSHLDDIFKTPAGRHFAEHIDAASYYDEERNAEELAENISSPNKNETLQDCLNKSAEEAFDKLVGQENQIQTPVRNTYNRKTAFDVRTPQAQSPFSAADVLSDLPKTDVEEWIETLDEAESPIMLQCEDDSESTEENLNDVFNLDQDELQTTDSECIIPETCTKVYLSETNTNTSTAATTALIKDPLKTTPAQVKEKETYSSTSMEAAEISGIDLLDQTNESIQNDESLLLMDEPSMFDEPLMVSDNESEANDSNEFNKQVEADTTSQIVLELSDDKDNQFNFDLTQESANNTLSNAQEEDNKTSAQLMLEFLEGQQDCNDLSEPLLLSDSEDLNLSQELEKSTSTRTEQTEYQQTINTESLQEQSILETEISRSVATNKDPLVTRDSVEDVSSTIIIADEDNVEEFANNTTEHENQVEEKGIDVKDDILEEENIQEIDVHEDEKPTTLAKEFVEISIKETNVESQKSDNIFIDTSVIEIFEETTPTPNEQQIVIKEDTLSAELSVSSKKDQECENIFMDSGVTAEDSQIDESFADEAEAETATGEEDDVEETEAAKDEITIVEDITNVESNDNNEDHSISDKYEEQPTNTTQDKEQDNNENNADIESIKDILQNETETNLQGSNNDNQEDQVENDDEIQLNLSSDEKSEEEIIHSTSIENVTTHEHQSAEENVASEEENIVSEEGLVTEKESKNSLITEDEISIASANEEIVLPATDKPEEAHEQDNKSSTVEVAPPEHDNTELQNSANMEPSTAGDDEKVEIILLPETISEEDGDIVEKEVLMNTENTTSKNSLITKEEISIASANEEITLPATDKPEVHEQDNKSSVVEVAAPEELQNTLPGTSTSNKEVSTAGDDGDVEIILLPETTSKEDDNIVEKDVLMKAENTTIESVNKSVTETNESESSIGKIKQNEELQNAQTRMATADVEVSTEFLPESSFTEDDNIVEKEVLMSTEDTTIESVNKSLTESDEPESSVGKVKQNEELQNTQSANVDVSTELLPESTFTEDDNIVEKEVLISTEDTTIESVTETNESESSIGKVKPNEELQITQAANVEVSTEFLPESTSTEDDNIVEKVALMSAEDTTIEPVNKSVTESDKSESNEKEKSAIDSAEISLIKDLPARSRLQSSEEHSEFLEKKIDENNVSKQQSTELLSGDVPASSLSDQVAEIEASKDSIEVISDIDNATSTAPEESQGKSVSAPEIVGKETFSSEDLTPTPLAVQCSSEMAQESKDNIFVAAEVVKSYNFEVKIKDMETAESSKNVLEVHTTRLTKKSNRTEEQSIEKSKEEEEIAKAKDNKTNDEKTDAEHNEINETKPIRSSRRKRTDSDSSQGSIHEGTNYNTRRERRKIIKKPTELKLLEEDNQVVEESLEKETQSDHIKEVIKRSRKRTASDSSQGSVKDVESPISTRRTRRKVQKAPVEHTVMEQEEQEPEVNAATAAENSSAIASSEQFENQQDKLLLMQEKDTSSDKQTAIEQESKERQGTSKIMEEDACKLIDNVEQLPSDILVSLETGEDGKNSSVIEELTTIDTPIPEKCEEKTDESPDNVEMLPSDIQASSEIAEDNKKSDVVEDQFSKETTNESKDNVEMLSSDILASTKSSVKQSLVIEEQSNSNEQLASSEIAEDNKKSDVVEDQFSQNIVKAEQSEETTDRSSNNVEMLSSVIQGASKSSDKQALVLEEQSSSNENLVSVQSDDKQFSAIEEQSTSNADEKFDENLTTDVSLEQQIEHEHVLSTQNISPIKANKGSEQESSTNILTEQHEEKLPTETLEQTNISADIHKPSVSESNLQSSVNADNSKIHTRRGREKLQTAQTEKIVAKGHTNVQFADIIDLTESESIATEQESLHDTKTAANNTFTGQLPNDTQFKEQTTKRTNRKLAATTSSQVLIHDDDNATHSRRIRRKVQKTPIGEEEDKTEENLQKVYHLTSTNNEAPPVDSEEISSTIQTVELEQQQEEKVVTVKDVKEKPIKRSRRKPTVSESSQGSLHDDDNASHSRRIRRKVQKTPLETVVIEENDDGELANKPTSSDHDTKSELPVELETTETTSNEINEIAAEKLAASEASPKSAIIQEQSPVNEEQSIENKMPVNEEQSIENKMPVNEEILMENSKAKLGTPGEEMNIVSTKRNRRKILPFTEELPPSRRKGRRKVQETSPEAIHDKDNLSVAAHHNLPETSALPEPEPEPSTSHRNRRKMYEATVEETNIEKPADVERIATERKDIILPPNETNDFKTHDPSIEEQHLQEKQIPKRVGRRPRVNTPQIIETKTVTPEENVDKDNDAHKELPASKTPEQESIVLASAEEVGIPQEKDATTDHHNEQLEHKKKGGRPAKKNVNRDDVTSNKRRIGRRKLAAEEHDIIEEHKTEQQSSDMVENIKDSQSENNSTHQQDNIEQQSTSHLPETKHRGRKHKETSLEGEEKSMEKIDIVSGAVTEPQTPQRTGSGASSRRVRKASAMDKEHHEHITAESNENDDTPSRRARNVPQRKAATAYHNYDETSDSEIPTKIKKKTDSPRKSLEVTKSSPTVAATVTAAPVIISSPSLLASGPTTTARGRTRKPTARVQQFLEEERAKAETPKKRALIAAAVAVDASTPQRTPARRGRKPSNLSSETEGTPQPPAKSRGRGRPPINTPINKEEENTKCDTTTAVVAEESEEITAHAHADSTADASAVVKAPRRVGRKAKLAEDDRNKEEEPPGKKSPVELKVSDKLDSSPAIDAPTPTRTTGKRNAAAAAKARIEEDALAAAALDPPKRGRTKKAPKIVAATPATTTNESSPDNKNLSQKAEERLNSSSSMLGSDKDDVAGVVEDKVEKETLENPIHKRVARKIAATPTTDSPAVPAKRGRKPKVVEEANEPETPDAEAKVVRGRGRRKVQPSTETPTSATQATIIATEPESVETATEPVKRGTRTRRK